MDLWVGWGIEHLTVLIRNGLQLEVCHLGSPCEGWVPSGLPDQGGVNIWLLLIEDPEISYHGVQYSRISYPGPQYFRIYILEPNILEYYILDHNILEYHILVHSAMIAILASWKKKTQDLWKKSCNIAGIAPKTPPMIPIIIAIMIPPMNDGPWYQGTAISTKSLLELVSRAASMTWWPCTRCRSLQWWLVMFSTHRHIPSLDLFVETTKDFGIIGTACILGQIYVLSDFEPDSLARVLGFPVTIDSTSTWPQKI